MTASIARFGPTVCTTNSVTSVWVASLLAVMAGSTGCVFSLGSFNESDRIDRTLQVVSDPLGDPGELVIDLDRGSVEVRGHDLPEVRIAGRADGMSSGSYRFEVEQDDDGVEITGRDTLHLAIPPLPPFIWRNSEDVQLRVWVARPYAVSVRSAHGRVDLSGLEGDVRVSAAHGRVDVASIGGDVDVRARHGRLRVDSVAGDVEIDTAHAPVTASRISGSLDVDSTHARVEVSAVSGKVRVRTSHSPVEIASAGAIDVENSHAPIRLSGAAGPVYARNHYAPIEAHFTGVPSGELVAHMSRIDVEIPHEMGTDLDALATYGSVNIGREIAVEGLFERDRIVAKLNGGGDSLRLTAKYGSIDLHAR